MKKRLLSAALALAMVLTLLPVSAFAATYQTPTQADPDDITYPVTSGGVTVNKSFYDPTTNTTVQVQRCTTPGDGTGREFGKWYWLDNKNDPQNPKYYEVTSGIIAGDNGSGNWYKEQLDFVTESTGTFEGTTGVQIKKLRSTTLTLLGGTNLNMGTGNWSDTTLRVDIEGNGTLTLAQNATNVTVTSKFVTGTPTGQVDAITRNHSAYSATNKGTETAALTLNATNVNVGAIDLDGRANTVILNNCVASTIDMNGETATNATTGKSYGRQALTITGGKVGAITIDKSDSAAVNLTSVNVGGTAAAVSVTSKGGTVTIAGASEVGALTVKSRATGTTDTANSAIPTVTVSGGKVTSISTTSDGGPGSASITLNRVTGNTNVGSVDVNKGSVSVAAGVTTTTITVPEGSVTIAGNTATNAAPGTGATTGKLTLGGTGTTTLSISGYGSDIAGIEVPVDKGANLRINSWPAGRNNYFGEVDLDGFSGKKITGGTFALKTAALPFSDAESYGWIDTSNLTYQAKVDGKAALYSVNELGQAIDDVNGSLTDLATDGPAATAGNIIPIGNTATNTLTLKYGTGILAKIQFSALTPVVLPTRLSSKNIVTWMQMDANDKVVKSYVSGQSYTVPAADITLNAADVAEDVTKITGIKNATTTSGGVNGNNIRAELRGNTIYLSGAVADGLNGKTGLALDLTTDVVDTNGNPVMLNQVPVNFDTKTKATEFNEFWGGENGAYTKNGQLILSNGTVYTVNGSGLSVSASNLQLAPADTNGYEIKVTVGGKMASWKDDAKDALIALLNGGSAGFDITGNRAMAEAINAAQATITSTTSVDNWVNSARTTIWTKGFKSADTSKNTAGGFCPNMTTHGGSYANAASADSDKIAITNAFSTAYIVPYLQVNITDYDESGTLTATLTPYYRVDVSGAAYDYTNGLVYTVQQGRALSALTGDMSTPLTVKFNLGASFATQKMHQDGKYVYTGVAGAWKINHAGTTGLGTIQINGLDGLIEVQNPKADGTLDTAMKYDSLQAAVDDTVPGVTKADGSVVNSQITIRSGFDGSCTFTMSGLARTINVKSLGNKDVSCTSNYVDKTDLNGVDFTFQLKRDAAVTTGNVDVVVNTADNGSVASSVAKANVDQVVTLTAMPNTGYKVKTITAVTNTNAAVTVTASGTNQYTFTVPKNVTKVTVTPTFEPGDNKANFAVNSSSRGTATAITGTADGRAQQGTTVPVAVSPNNGYRTVGLTARGNNGSTASVTRTGTNSFNVTVPVGATTVTVTPSFDVNTGTPFADVLSNHWASSSITWAYNNKYIEGTGAYSYSPSSYMTLGEVVAMLYKAAGSPPVTGMSNPYTNLTPNSHWAYNAIIWAANQRLISSSTGTINPWGYATRAEIVEILYRRANSPTVYGTSGFADVASNASYSKAVTWARQKGLTNGYGGNTYFRPGYAVSRAEMAAFLQRAFSNVG